MPFHDNVFTVEEDTQFGERCPDFAELLTKSFEGTLQSIDGNALFD
jgi:hypothetical protein